MDDILSHVLELLIDTEHQVEQWLHDDHPVPRTWASTVLRTDRKEMGAKDELYLKQPVDVLDGITCLMDLSMSKL